MARTGRAATNRRAGTEDITDVLELLTEDHRKVRQMFEDFEDLGESDSAEKYSLGRQICFELTVHAAVEEELFYPAARAALGVEGESLLNEAEVRHGSAKELIALILAEPLDDARFDAQVKVLGEYIGQHVEEEEGELFELVRDSNLNLEELGAELMERKEVLRGEIEEQISA